MELCEMIKVMQHYADGGDVEYSEDCFKTIKGESNNKNRLGLSWDWNEFDYRIKEQKQKVIIEKWLCQDIGSGEYFIYDTSKIDLYINCSIKVKLIESYEIEL